MNFQSLSMLPPIRIMMINPLINASKLTVVRLLSGHIFEVNRPIDIILLVYANEIADAEAFVQEILACGYLCLNTIVATSDLPSITDADIFCCMSNLDNPNNLDFNTDNDVHFDTVYLYIKVALSLGNSQKSLKEEYIFNEDKTKMIKKPKPIFFGDGLLVLDILNIMGAEGMSGGYFCAGCIPALARSTLAECLKVRSTEINSTYVWGVNFENFHVEIEKPYIISDNLTNKPHCDWEMVSNDVLNALNVDSTDFNATWMRKDFIHKLKEMAHKNPYGPIFRAYEMSSFIAKCWLPRITKKKACVSLGTISDGSLRTLKGLPYILPILMNPDGTWEVNHCYENTPIVIQEIKKYNKIVKETHAKLKKYCHKFLQENVISLAFVPTEYSDSTSASYPNSLNYQTLNI